MTSHLEHIKEQYRFPKTRRWAPVGTHEVILAAFGIALPATTERIPEGFMTSWNEFLGQLSEDWGETVGDMAAAYLRYRLSLIEEKPGMFMSVPAIALVPGPKAKDKARGSGSHAGQR